jgi:ComF family protein
MGTQCFHCKTWLYNFDEARAWGKYGGELRKAILSLKKRHNTQLGSELAKCMADVLAAQAWKIDYLVPIPLAPHRLVERGYNQAEILAQPLAYLSGLRYAGTILHRSHETVKQFELSANQRWENLLGAFKTEDIQLHNANVLLIDDIMTTGATLNAAALALKKVGCQHVYALTLAKTLFDEE